MIPTHGPLLDAALMALTIAAYLGARRLYGRTRLPILHPVFISAGAMIAILHLAGLSFADYGPAKGWLTAPLGPATAALAVPIYNQRARLRALLAPLLGGVALGTLAAIAVALGLGALGRLAPPVLEALAVKSVTAAIGVELARLRGGDPALAAVFAVATGIGGAVLGPPLLDRLRVTDPAARGIALGAIAHAIGTAAALAEGEEAGALAGLAMIGAALVTTLVAPVYIPWLLHLLGR